jgi:hypothetical protein
MDKYFAVMRSWIEEIKIGCWEIKMALLGFTQMNSAYNGAHLGQVLYKIADQLGIVHKV